MSGHHDGWGEECCASVDVLSLLSDGSHQHLCSSSALNAGESSSLGGGLPWQFGGSSSSSAAAAHYPQQLIPMGPRMRLPASEDAGEPQAAASAAAAAPQWLLPAGWAAQHPSSHSGTMSTGTGEDWAISTASHPDDAPQLNNSAEHALQSLLGGAASGDAGCSDPLIATAQELVAAAAASATPGVHAAVADSAALLNSGAVLLLGHASTTMHGTNTAQGEEQAAGGLLSAPACGPPLMRASSASSASCSVPSMPAQLRHVASASGAEWMQRPAHRPVRKTRSCSRRRLGLLVDSEAGMQQLVAAASANMPEQQAARQQQQQQDEDEHQEQQQDEQQQQLQVPVAHQDVAGVEPAGTTGQGSEHAPASGDVLVLGMGCQGHACQADAQGHGSACAGGAQAHTDAAAATAAAAAADNTASGCAGSAHAATEEDETEAGAHVAVGGGGAPVQVPVLQLLSCSSLASLPPATRSNSGLMQVNFSNCSFLRLGSLSTTAGSFCCDHNSFTSQRYSGLPAAGSRYGSLTGAAGGPAGLLGSLDGSFTAQRHGSFTAQRQGSLTAAQRQAQLMSYLRLGSFTGPGFCYGGPDGSFTSQRHAALPGGMRLSSFTAGGPTGGAPWLLGGGADGSFTSQRHSMSCLRLGSFTAAAAGGGGINSSADGSFSSTRHSSWSGPLQGVAAGAAGAPDVLHPSGSGGAGGGGAGGAGAAAAGTGTGVAAASRPSPLPMLHESSSWASGLNEAGPKPAQQSHSEVLHGQQPHSQVLHADGLQQQQQPPQQQLIYLLD